MQYCPKLHVWAPLAVSEVRQLLAPSATRWWLSGGQAIDQWLGRRTRSHGDIDISVVRTDWSRLIAELPTHLVPHAAVDGNLLPLRNWLTNPRLRNIWLCDERTGHFVLQVNIEEGDDFSWQYRRAPRIAVPWESAVHLVNAVPTGSLPTQFLWNSPAPRARDDADLDVALPLLTPADRTWLRQSIRTAHQRRLGSATGGWVDLVSSGDQVVGRRSDTSTA